MPTTPFGAPHFTLRFWLTLAAVPPHSAEARISSGPHDSTSPFSCTKRILALPGKPCSPRSPLVPEFRQVLARRCHLVAGAAQVHPACHRCRADRRYLAGPAARPVQPARAGLAVPRSNPSTTAKKQVPDGGRSACVGMQGSKARVGDAVCNIPLRWA